MAIWYVDSRILAAAESDSFDGGLGVGKLRDELGDVADAAPGDYIFLARNSEFIGLWTVPLGLDGDWVNVLPYGEGDYLPRVNGDGSNIGSVYVNAGGYVRIRGLELYGSAGGSSGAAHILNSNFVEILDCYIHDSRQGVRIDNTQNSDKTDFLVEGNLIQDINNVGITAVTGSSSGGTMHNVTYRRNRLENCGYVDLTPGMQLTTRIGSTSTYDATRVIFDAVVDDNILIRSRTYGMFNRYVTRARFRRNEVTRTCVENDEETHTMWFGGCRDGLVYANEVHHNGGDEGASAGAGVGIYIDQGSPSSTGHECQRMRVIGNHIYNQFDGNNSAATPGAGITVFRSVDTLVAGNYLHDLLFGISVRGANTQNSERNLVLNNTCRRIARAAFLVSNKADATVFRNNVADDCLVGFFAETGANAATNTTREYNCAHGATEQAWAEGTIGTYTEGAAGTGDITDDPALTTDGNLSEGSPCLEVGLYQPKARDRYMRKLKRTPDMGASQRWGAIERAL